jgi:hypothetical protein
MPKAQNEGVGGELGRKTKQWSLLGGDAYWGDSGNKKWPLHSTAAARPQRRNSLGLGCVLGALASMEKFAR